MCMYAFFFFFFEGEETVLIVAEFFRNEVTVFRTLFRAVSYVRQLGEWCPFWYLSVPYKSSGVQLALEICT